jgi:hypothetical protein
MIVEKKISEIRSSSNLDVSNTYLTTDKFQEGMWRIDPADSTSADNTGTILVNASQQRFKRIVESNVNVKWFGASGQNNQDDYPALQAAIDASNNIYIPSGDYQISRPLRVISNKTITGDGSEITQILKTTNATLGGTNPILNVDAIMIIDPTGGVSGYAIGVKFADIRFCSVPNNVTNVVACQYGIFFPYSYFTHIENVSVRDCKYGLFTRDTFQSRFIAVVSSRVDYGFTWQQDSGRIAGTSCTFERCWTTEVRRRGYNLIGLQYSNLLNCAADHVGKDLQDTAESTSYYLENCRGIKLSACGTEDLMGRALAIITCQRIVAESLMASTDINGKTFPDADMALLTIKNSGSVSLTACEFYANNPVGTLKDYYIDNSSVQLHTTTYTSYASANGNYLNASRVTDYGFNSDGQLQNFANKIYRMDKSVVTARVELNETNFWLPEKFIHIPDNAVLKEIRVFVKQSLNKSGYFNIKYYGASQSDYYFKSVEKIWSADEVIRVNPVLSKSLKPTGLSGDWTIHAEPQTGYNFYGGLVLIVEADYFMNMY